MARMAWLLAGFVVMVAACGEAPTDGLVVRLAWADGEPAAGVHVQAVPRARVDEAEPATEVTDASGAACFTSVAPGSYGVLVGRPLVDEGRRPVEVAAGELAQVAWTIADGVDVAGVVRNERGAPIAGAVVLIDGRGQWRYDMHVATTDDHGRFSLRSLGKTQKLKVRHSDYQASRTERGRANVSITLLDGARSVSGVVRNDAGDRVADATVELMRAAIGYRDGALRFQKTRTDAAGRYTFAGLRHAPVSVIATAPGFAKATRRTKLSEPGVHELDMTITPGWSVSGTITDAQGDAVMGARVRWSDAPVDDRQTTSDEKGAFILEHLPESRRAGGVLLVMDHPDYVRVTTDEAFVPARGATWDVALERGGMITGTLFEPNGELTKVAFVTLWSGARRVASTVVRDGRFRFAQLRDGFYDVEITWVGGGRAEPQTDVAPGSDLELRVIAPGRIRGRVVEAERSSFRLVGDDGRESVALDADGGFDEEVLAGEYQLELARSWSQASARGGDVLHVEPGVVLDLGDIHVVDRGEVVVDVTLADGVTSDQVDLRVASGSGRPTAMGVRSVGDRQYAVDVGGDAIRLVVRGAGIAWAEHGVDIEQQRGRTLPITVERGFPLDLEVSTGDGGTRLSELDLLVRDDAGTVVYTRRLPLMKGARPLTLSLAPGRYVVRITDEDGRQARDTVDVTEDGAWLAVHIP